MCQKSHLLQATQLIRGKKFVSEQFKKKFLFTHVNLILAALSVKYFLVKIKNK